eukprot:TRINITY_DN65486_c0_g1_i1.p1 TRINITY_DN65486_c0_g1~~TRINITY_DN65486_c0_g1_i1.p1  ORF type:complete len:469 (+),score=96.06 TRINITY_DN65486_c0_g1_i1:26-1432(+)
MAKMLFFSSTPRLSLRIPQLVDLSALHDIKSDPNVNKMYGSGSPPSENQVLDCITNSATKNVRRFTAVNVQGNVVGEATLQWKGHSSGWYVGLAVDPKLQRTGLGSDMLACLLAMFFDAPHATTTTTQSVAAPTSGSQKWVPKRLRGSLQSTSASSAGFGMKATSSSSRQPTGADHLNCIKAGIWLDNTPSISFFEKKGFAHAHKNSKVTTMVLKRSDYERCKAAGMYTPVTELQSPFSGWSALMSSAGPTNNTLSTVPTPPCNTPSCNNTSVGQQSVPHTVPTRTHNCHTSTTVPTTTTRRNPAHQTVFPPPPRQSEEGQRSVVYTQERTNTNWRELQPRGRYQQRQPPAANNRWATGGPTRTCQDNNTGGGAAPPPPPPCHETSNGGWNFSSNNKHTVQWGGCQQQYPSSSSSWQSTGAGGGRNNRRWHNNTPPRWNTTCSGPARFPAQQWQPGRQHVWPKVDHSK